MGPESYATADGARLWDARAGARPPVDDDMVVLRCGACGDTFPAPASDAPCPSCGERRAEIAWEPLL